MDILIYNYMQVIFLYLAKKKVFRRIVHHILAGDYSQCINLRT